MFHRERDTVNCDHALSECDRDFESPREVLAGQDRWVAKRLTVIQVAVYAIVRLTECQLQTGDARACCKGRTGTIA